jgi:hypothetical protein
VKHQAYCSKPGCQRERKRQWHRGKLLSDPEYEGARREAQSKWLGKNPCYWRSYRESHSAYVKRNRERQRERNALRRQRAGAIAKTDASPGEMPFISGMYDLVPAAVGRIAKTDVIRAEIRFISRC